MIGLGSDKNMLSIWALPVCGRDVNVCPDGLGQTFLQSKFLTFGVPKCLPGWFVAKKGPKVLGAPQDEATAWRNGANFPDCTFQPLLRLFSQVGVSIISKRVKNTPEIFQSGVYQSSANG